MAEPRKTVLVQAAADERVHLAPPAYVAKCELTRPALYELRERGEPRTSRQIAQAIVSLRGRLLIFARRGHIRRMALPVAPPRMEPKPLKVGTGWYVLVTWEDGQTEIVGDFANERSAELWMERESSQWEALRRATRD